MLISHEEFFLHTVEDLRNRIKENSAYSIIRACGLCRQLVEEKNWLLKKANQRTQIKLSFLILDNDRDLFKIPMPIIWITVDPILKKTTEVDRDEFLDTYVLRLKKHTYQVRDIIKVAANKMGGVHSDDLHHKDKKSMAFYD